MFPLTFIITICQAQSWAHCSVNRNYKLLSPLIWIWRGGTHITCSSAAERNRFIHASKPATKYKQTMWSVAGPFFPRHYHPSSSSGIICKICLQMSWGGDLCICMKERGCWCWWLKNQHNQCHIVAVEFGLHVNAGESEEESQSDLGRSQQL